MNLTSSEYKINYAANGVPDAATPAPAEVIDNRPTKTKTGDVEHKTLRIIREGLETIVNSWLEEIEKTGLRKYEITIDQETTQSTDLKGYQEKSKKTFKEFDNALDKGLEYGEVLSPVDILKVLKFTLSHMRFATDMSVKAAAFVDFHRLLDSFNEKLVGLTNEKGLMKDIRGAGREKLFKLMMYQGSLAFLVLNSEFRVKETDKSDYNGLSFNEIFDPSIKDFSQNENEFNSALLSSDSLDKINAILHRRKGSSQDLLVDSNNTPASKLDTCSLADLIKSKWDNLTGEGSIIAENSLKMHLHIVRNEFVKGHEDIIGVEDDKNKPETVDKVDSSLLDTNNYYDADDLSSFMRASEFMMFNATSGVRSIVNLTTLHFLLADTDTNLTVIELLLSNKDEDPFNKKVGQVINTLMPSFVDERKYLPIKIPKSREEDDSNILEYALRAYDMLQNDKTAKAYVHNFGVPMVKGLDTRVSYIPSEPTSKEFQGETARTTIDRIAAAKFAQYIVSTFSLPIRNVNLRGKLIEPERNNDGKEIPFNIANKIKVKFRIGIRNVQKEFRRSNLTLELFKKLWPKLGNNGSAPQINIGQFRVSFTSQDRRIPPCFLVFLTARKSAEKNHAAALLGSDDDSISNLTLKDGGLEGLIKQLTTRYNNGDSDLRNPLAKAGTEMRLHYSLFKEIFDRGGALFTKTDAKPGQPLYDPDITKFGANASAWLPDLLGVSPAQLYTEDPKSKINLVNEDLAKANEVLDKIEGWLMKIYLNADKSPVPLIRKLVTAGLYHLREKLGLKNREESKIEDASTAKVNSSIDMVYQNTGLYENLLAVFGKRSDHEINVMFSDKNRPFYQKYADAFDIFFGRFTTRVKFKIGNYEDGNSWYLNFAGQRIERQTLSAGELYGVTHLKGRTNEGHVDGYSARLDLENEDVLKAVDLTIKYLPKNSIRLFLELFNGSLPVRKNWVKAYRFTIDPEYIMADGYGTTISRKEMRDGTELEAQLSTIFSEIKDKDKKNTLFTDPYTSLRIVSEVNKIIKTLVEPDENDRRFDGDNAMYIEAQKDYTKKLKELTLIARFWTIHALNTNVSAHHTLKSAVGSSYSNTFVDSEIPLKRVLEKPFEQTGIKKLAIWVESVVTGITLQVATTLTGESLHEASLRINNHAFDFQRSKVDSSTFYELFLNPDNIYRSKASVIRGNGFPTMESFLRQNFGDTNGNQAVRFFDYVESDGGDMVQEVSQRIYNMVENFNQSFSSLGKILREKIAEDSSDEQKIKAQQKQDQARIDLGILNSNAEKLVVQYPDFFTLRNKTKIEKSKQIQVNELEILIPTGFLHPMHGDLMKPHKPNSNQTFSGLLNFYDGDDTQIYGSQNIAISKFLRGFVQGVVELKRITEIQVSTQTKSGDFSHGEQGNISALRIVSEVVKKSKEWETGAIITSKGIEMRDALFTERLGIPYKLFLRDVMYSMKTTPKEIIAEINKWRELSMRDNKQLKGVLTEGIDKVAAQTPAREFMRPLKAIGGFIGKIIFPTNNLFRSAITARYWSAGLTVTAGTIAIGSVIAATSGTVLLPFVGIPFVALAAGHFVTSLASYGINICMRDFAIYGPEGNDHRGRPARTLIKIANNTFRKFPFWRERYAKYNKERETRSVLEKTGLGKSQIVKEHFDPDKIATLFGLTVNQLPQDLLSSLKWLKDSIEDIPGGISIPDVEKPKEEQAIQAGK